MSDALHVGDRIIYFDDNWVRTRGVIIAPAKSPPATIEPSEGSSPGMRSSDERFWRIELDNGTSRFAVPESKLQKEI